MPDPELPPAPTWEPLSVVERRVLGVLVEKNKTTKTPDTYPMTLNSVTVGCNQKSNRDPLLELDSDEVEEALDGLMKKGLTIKQQGGRADRWRHLLYDAWSPTKVELAILAELLLRGRGGRPPRPRQPHGRDRRPRHASGDSARAVRAESGRLPFAAGTRGDGGARLPHA